MPVDEAIETHQCSLATTKAFSPFNISPLSPLIRRKPVLEDAKQQAWLWDKGQLSHKAPVEPSMGVFL